MSTNGFALFPSAVTADQDNLGRNWGWFLALGVALILAGMTAIAYPVMATVTTIEIFGFVLVFGAAVEIASAVWAGRWGGFFLHLFGGLLYLFVGVLLIERPAAGAAVYTLILAVFFVAAGLVRAVFALTHHFHGWGWAVLSGVVTFVLGVMIWRQWPGSAFWVVGTFVGIELIFNGLSWVMLGTAARSMRRAVTGAAARPVGV